MRNPRIVILVRKKITIQSVNIDGFILLIGSDVPNRATVLQLSRTMLNIWGFYT